MTESGWIQKRNRISFSCLGCRKRKSKCDRKKPSCSKCTRLDVSCLYDTERQPTPRKPTKGAETISELQKELEYWKTRACQLNVLQNDVPKIVHPIYDTLSEVQLNEEEQNYPINLAINHDKLIIHKQMKYYHRPFSTLALLQRDLFLNVLTGSLYGSTFTDLHIKSKTRQNGIPVSCEHTIEKPVHLFLEKIIDKTIKERRKVTNTTDPTILFASSFVLEDCPEEEYPPVLRLLLSEIEAALPDAQSLMFYLSTFYCNIYPMFPYLNVSQFDNILKLVLVKDGLRYRIVLGSSSLRIKLEMLCILMATMILTYTSLRLQNVSESITPNSYDIFGSNKITENILVCCERCLCLLNSSMFTNENILCCLLYLKIIENLRPEIGDMVIGQELIITLSSISEISLIIGLHKDPTFYLQLRDTSIVDSSIQNYRRKTWLNTVAFTMNMLLPNGSDSRILLDHLLCFEGSRNEPYMELVEKYMSSSDSFDLLQHDLMNKQYQVIISLVEITNKSLHLYKLTTIGKIQELYKRSKTTLNIHFPLTALRNKPNDSDETINFHGIRKELGSVGFSKSHLVNWKTLEVHLMAKTVYLNTCWGVCNFVESQNKENTPQHTKLFQIFFVEGLKECLELVNLIIQYLSDGINGAIPSGYAYCTDMTVVTLLPRLYLFLISSILRCQIAEDYIDSVTSSEAKLYSTNPVSNMAKLKRTKQSLVEVLRSLVQLSNKGLARKYLSCQKANCLFEYVLHAIDIGHLSNITYRFWNYHLTSKPIPQTVSNNVLFKWGLDVKNSNHIKQSLNKINVFNASPEIFFDSLLNLTSSLSLPKENIQSPCSDIVQPTTDPNSGILDFFDNFNVTAFEMASVLYPSM